MPRSRNIKPAFFVNDDLAEIPPLGRLLFIGLWTLADYKGDLEWKPKRIKAQILPYDNCDIKKIAINLDQSRFIRFYSNTENIYIRVLNFNKHQNPHKNERIRGSDIPEFTDEHRQLIDLTTLTINRDQNGINRDQNETDPADSLLLIPDSLNPIEARTPPFEVWYEIYPIKKSKQKARQSWQKQKLDNRVDELIGILNNQIKNDAQWIDGIGIPHPSTYLNQKRWKDEILPINEIKKKPDWAKIPRNDDELWDWAKKYEYPGPGQLTYNQYRQTLNKIVDKRLNNDRLL